VFCCLFSLLAPCSALRGLRRLGISDGDTITVLQDERCPVKIRLYGIDCPEKRQAWAIVLLKAHVRLCYDKVVDVEEAGLIVMAALWPYIIFRMVPACKNGLCKKAWRWVWPRYCKLRSVRMCVQEKQQSREAGVGLWRDERADTAVGMAKSQLAKVILLLNALANHERHPQ
jgi:hypothetical protein